MALLTRFLFLTTTLAIAACTMHETKVEPETTTPPPSSAGTPAVHHDATTSPAASTGTSDNGVLKILNLSSNVKTITYAFDPAYLDPTDATTVTLIAILTDSKGQDSIAGGQVTDDTGVTYAAFETGSTKGTYSATLTWSDINTVRPIDTGIDGSRVLSARFFDNDGNTATASVSLELDCATDLGDGDDAYELHPPPYGACAGSCMSLGDDPMNCGGCGTACKTGQTCQSGTCAAPANVATSNPTTSP